VTIGGGLGGLEAVEGLSNLMIQRWEPEGRINGSESWGGVR